MTSSSSTPKSFSQYDGHKSDHRSTISERAARDPKTGKTVRVPGEMTYRDWKDVIVDKKMPVEEWKMRMNLEPPSEDFMKMLAKEQGKPYTGGKKKDSVEFYMADDGVAPIWPGNDGAIGHVHQVTLSPGDLILSRYGDNYGRFVSPAGTTVAERALSPTTNLNNEHWFVVLKDIKAYRGRIAAWFNQPGGGIQYKFRNSIAKLIEAEMLKELSKDEYNRIKKNIGN